MNLTCNSTLEELRIHPGTEIPIAGSLTFHQLAIIIGGVATCIAILMSLYLIMMHALHYTKPSEQRQIIRILFMVPTYSTASFLALCYYWHAIYFQVMSDCYEAFAISSFFALLCHYIAPDLHEQKEYFRLMQPIKPWIWPLDWFRKCCGGERGPWRTPQSGLTWFNINWIGIYHYCFIRVFMTITAVVTQYFERYCESSNNPVFSHIWIITINALAVTVAMYCLIQFYVQLRVPLAEHSPFLKVLAIKLVIFLSFWQTAAISVGTSSLNIVHANETIAYPDLKVGIPSMLLCVEMAIFAVLHLWAFPYSPYLDNAKTSYYPLPNPDSDLPPKMNDHLPRAGGPLGLKALWDAMNLWDVVKAFGRGIRWLFVGVKHRHKDVSYHTTRKSSVGEASASVGMENLPSKHSRLDDLHTSYPPIPPGMLRPDAKSTDHLPIATEFRRSQYLDVNAASAATVSAADQQQQRQQQQQHQPQQQHNPADYHQGGKEERVGLIANAQPDPHDPYSSPYAGGPGSSHGYADYDADSIYRGRAGTLSTVDEESDMYRSSSRFGGSTGSDRRTSTQIQLGAALWGSPKGAGYDHGRTG